MTAIDPDREAEVPRTSRRWKAIAFVLLLVLLAPASWLARLGASKMEFFHLRAVTVEGTRYLSPETVVERLALDTMRSVWDDTEPLAGRLRTMSQVSRVEISRKLPGTLVVRIHENLPVALAPSPRGLEPVDTAGTVLPIDPLRDDLDLPVANQRDVGILAMLGSIRAQDPRLYSRIPVSRDGRERSYSLSSLDESRTTRQHSMPDSAADESPATSDRSRPRADGVSLHDWPISFRRIGPGAAAGNRAELDLRSRDSKQLQ